MNNICSGDALVIFNTVGNVLTIIKIAVPILLIIMGSLDLMKAVMAGKDDEIKKSQGTFVKRAIAAVLVFFIPTIVGLIMSLIDQDRTPCLTCILNTSTCNVSASGSGNNGDSGNTGNLCSNLNENQCNQNSDCIWTDMSRYGEQFNNLETNNYYCAIR